MRVSITPTASANLSPGLLPPGDQTSRQNLIDHYFDAELDAAWHSHATRLVYREFLIRWIKPFWGSFNIRDVRTVAVESWLRQLRRRDGDDLANSSKAKIRNVMSVVFNPTQRMFALKWKDIDFCNLSIDIKRSIFRGVVGHCKNETSRLPVPLSLNVADLWLWKETICYAAPDDWVFASPRRKGIQPLRPEGQLSKIIRRAAVQVGRKKRIGWHTFRHTYSSTLIANGETLRWSRN